MYIRDGMFLHAGELLAAQILCHRRVRTRVRARVCVCVRACVRV